MLVTTKRGLLPFWVTSALRMTIARHLLFRPGHGKRLESGLGPEERGGLMDKRMWRLVLAEHW